MRYMSIQNSVCECTESVYFYTGFCVDYTEFKTKTRCLETNSDSFYQLAEAEAQNFTDCNKEEFKSITDIINVCVFPMAFGLNSESGIIEPTTILITHPSLSDTFG